MNFSFFVCVYFRIGQVERSENRIIYGLRYLQGQGSTRVNTLAPNKFKFLVKTYFSRRNYGFLGEENIFQP